MPDRSRSARRNPPSTWDHVLSHPVEMASAALWVLLGAMILIGLLPGMPGISRGVDALPLHSAIGLALAVLVGGVLTMLGACWPGERLDTAWRLERTGLILAIGGWSGYMVILFSSQQVAAFTVSLALSQIGGGVLRLIAIRGVEQDTRREMTEAGMNA